MSKKGDWLRIYDPIYNPPLSADSILLATDDVRILVGQKVVRGKAEVRFSFFPDLRVRIKVSNLQGDAFGLIAETSAQLEFSSGHQPVEVLLTKINLKKGDAFVEAIQSHDFVFIGRSKNVSRIAFALVNFVEFWSDSYQSEQGNTYQTIVLETGEWRIFINQFPDIRNRLDHLKGIGGFVMTHAGTIERVNNRFITTKAAEKIERGLGLFLSFARGFFCHPVLSCGITSTGKKVWERWGNPLVDRYRPVFSWFDVLHPIALPAAFQGFWKKWNEEVWTSTLSAVICWYSRSNPAQSGTDGSLILSQTGLERLAWAYLVESKKSLSREGFARLPAADQIRLLLFQCGIPLDVPANLRTLSAFARKFNLDGPGAITEVRNSIIHPSSKRALNDGVEIVDSWLLSVWYLELVLLSLFGYSGEYTNRLRRCVEKVPWAT